MREWRLITCRHCEERANIWCDQRRISQECFDVWCPVPVQVLANTQKYRETYRHGSIDPCVSASSPRNLAPHWSKNRECLGIIVHWFLPPHLHYRLARQLMPMPPPQHPHPPPNARQPNRLSPPSGHHPLHQLRLVIQCNIRLNALQLCPPPDALCQSIEGLSKHRLLALANNVAHQLPRPVPSKSKRQRSQLFCAVVWQSFGSGNGAQSRREAGSPRHKPPGSKVRLQRVSLHVRIQDLGTLDCLGRLPPLTQALTSLQCPPLRNSPPPSLLPPPLPPPLKHGIPPRAKHTNLHPTPHPRAKGYMPPTQDPARPRVVPPALNNIQRRPARRLMGKQLLLLPLAGSVVEPPVQGLVREATGRGAGDEAEKRGVVPPGCEHLADLEGKGLGRFFLFPKDWVGSFSFLRIGSVLSLS
jgi:hypothetical protein